MSETITLDPPAVATNRTELDITPFISGDGVDWGEAAIEQSLADAERGSMPIDFRIPNRVIAIPLKLQTRGATSFSTIRRNLQYKVALFQKEAGWLKREIDSTPWYAEVVNARLKLGGSWLQAHRSVDPDATLVLECRPDFFGAEVDLGLVSETTNPELITTLTGITGDYPARARIVVTDAQAQNQLGLLWGLRSRHFSSAASAAMAYAATAMTPMDTAAVSGNVIQHTNLSTTWTPVLNTNTSGTFLTHTGTYRVWASVLSPQGTDVRVRFLWDVGDMTLPVENASMTVPGSNQFYLMDLGEIRLQQALTGTHRWQGVVQAIGAAGGEDVQVRRLWFQPIDDGAGRLSVPTSVTTGLVGFSARDEFVQTAGNLTGKTATIGGTWVGAGDADDFTVNATDQVAQRTAVSDAAAYSGRYATLDTNLAATLVQVDIETTKVLHDLRMGVLARYAGTNDWLGLIVVGSDADDAELEVRKRVAGATTRLASLQLPSFSSGQRYTLRLVVTAVGTFSGWIVPAGSSFGTATISGSDSALATGGTLASGDVGIYDENADSVAATRVYDQFAASVPSLDAVIFASQSAELRTDGMIREDSTGTAYGPITQVIGDLPRLPVAGLEARDCQLFLKPTRGDLATVPDGGNADDFNARAYYRPSWLFSP